MAVVALGIGSNINAVANISRAVKSLKLHFGNLELSPVYQSEAVGFDGDDFLNLVALVNVEDDIGRLSRILKKLEDQQGRDRTAEKFSGRTLDIDVLIYDELQGIYSGITLPRPEITENAYVLLPLSQILPEVIHPLLHKTYRQLWKEYEPSRQKLQEIEIDWNCKQGISD